MVTTGKAIMIVLQLIMLLSCLGAVSQYPFAAFFAAIFAIFACFLVEYFRQLADELSNDLYQSLVRINALDLR